MTLDEKIDCELTAVAAQITRLDPSGERTSTVLRQTLDLLYDGGHTARYRWDQLNQTERTRCSKWFAINLHREFKFDDSELLDYKISGHDVDCQYSPKMNRWFIPGEAHDHICLLVWACDVESVWSLGLVKATASRLSSTEKPNPTAILNARGCKAIQWLFDRKPLHPNVLLKLEQNTVDQVMSLKSRVARLNALFRHTLGMRVGRGAVATIALQSDPIKRRRDTCRSRSALRHQGIVLLSQTASHVAIARQLCAEVPGPGDCVALRLTAAKAMGPGVANIDGGLWRLATDNDPIELAPKLPR